MSQYKIISNIGIHFPEDATLTHAIKEAKKFSEMTNGEVTIYLVGKSMDHEMAKVKDGEVRLAKKKEPK